MNKKLIKILSVCALAGAIGVGAFALSGCNKGGDEGGPGTGQQQTGGTQATDHTFTYSYSAVPAQSADEAQLTSLGTANAFLTITGDSSSAVTWRNKALSANQKGTDCIEIKRSALSVTFSGTGTITVNFSSSGSSNDSGFGLTDAEGNYLTPDSGTTATAGTGNNAGLYIVKGTSAVAISYTITKSGTYKLVGAYFDSGSFKRGTRIHGITMVDHY